MKPLILSVLLSAIRTVENGPPDNPYQITANWLSDWNRDNPGYGVEMDELGNEHIVAFVVSTWLGTEFPNAKERDVKKIALRWNAGRTGAKWPGKKATEYAERIKNLYKEEVK